MSHSPTPRTDDRVPYAKPQPWGMAADMVVPNVLTDDPLLWAPVGEGIWSRPIHLNVTGGFYTHLLKVKRSGLLQRHRHSGQVQALCHERQMALPGARLGGRRRQLCVRATG